MAGKKPTIDADSPQCGFYKIRDGKDGPWLPVMIRMDGDVMRCRVGDNSDADPIKIWTWCAARPISKEDAKHAFETGSFPGDAPTIGDNSGEVGIADQIKDYAAQALDWFRKSGIKDEKSKDMAANYRAELLRMSKEADTSRVAEKKPHDDAAKAVQAKWKPVIDTADCAAEELRAGLTAFMTAEKRRLEAEQRAKWEAEQKAAAVARAEIEAHREKQMRDDPIAALTSPEPELPMAPPPPEPVKVQAGGQRGRKTGLREVTRYVVTDHAKALAFFAESEDVRELVGKLADRSSKAGVAVPGVEKRIEEVAA
ncbi:MAG: hypothetical protein ABL931_18815 [Usitatibacteraceae bacterium]